MSPEIIKELYILLGAKEDGQSIARAQKAMGDLASMAKWAAGAVAAVSAAFAAVGKQAFDNAETVDRWRARIGGTAEEVSKLAAAAAALGFEDTLGMEGAVEVAERASDLVRNVKALTGDAGESFKALGFTSVEQLKGADGQMRNALDLFNDVVDRLAKVENAGDRTGIAMRMFGDDVGQKLVPALLELAQAKKDAEDMGAVMSEDDLKMAREMRRAWGKVSLGLRGLGLTIGRTLAPAVKDILGRMGAWLKQNRAWLKLKLERATQLFNRALIATWDIFKTLVADLRPIVRMFGGLENVLKAIAVVLGVVLVYRIGAAAMALGQLGMALMSAAKGAGLLTAFGAILAIKVILIGAAVVALVLILEDLWRGLNGGKSAIFELLDALFNGDPKKKPWWVKVLQDALRPIKELLDGLRKVKKAIEEGDFSEAGKQLIKANARAAAAAITGSAGMDAVDQAIDGVEAGNYGRAAGGVAKAGVGVAARLAVPWAPGVGSAAVHAVEDSWDRGALFQARQWFDPAAPDLKRGPLPSVGNAIKLPSPAPHSGGPRPAPVIHQNNTYNIHGGQPERVQAAAERGTRRGLAEAGRELPR